MRSLTLAAFLLSAAPALGASTLIPHAAPEAVASTIIPGMLQTQWRLVAESPHSQTWERAIQGGSGIAASLIGSLVDGPIVNAPIDRVTYTFASSPSGTLVQSTWFLVMAPGSGIERATARTAPESEAKMQAFLDAVKVKLTH